jgi:hypothetical protein
MVDPNAVNDPNCGLFDALNGTCPHHVADPEPIQPTPRVQGEQIEGALALVAVGGTYDVLYGAGGNAVTIATTGDGFTAAIVDRDTIEVTAAKPGVGELAVTYLEPTKLTLEAVEVADVIIDAPAYLPLDGHPTAFLGADLTAAVHLVDAKDRYLADETLTVEADWAKSSAHDTVTATGQAPGPRTLTVSAQSVDGGAPRTLDLAIVDAIDDVILDVDQSQRDFVRLCGHAMRQGDEVFARWTLNPSYSSYAGPGAIPYDNCVYIRRGRPTSFTVSGEAGGIRRELEITAR